MGATTEVHGGSAVMGDEPTMVEIEEERGLARRVAGSLSLDRMLMRDPDRVVMMVENRAKALERVRLGAIKITDPIDWTINVDKEGRKIATLRKSGCSKVRKHFGVSTGNIRPQEVKVTQNSDGTTTAEIWGDAFCGLTGEFVQNLRGARTSGEQFTGRTEKETNASKALELSDLKEACRTNLENKAVRILSGMTAVPVEELKTTWGSEKDVERCYKGHGYGSSADRKAGVNIDLLRAVVKAVAEATKKAEDVVLKDCTIYKKGDKTYWARALSDIRYDWQIERAIDRLKEKHPDIVGKLLEATQPPKAEVDAPAEDREPGLEG